MKTWTATDVDRLVSEGVYILDVRQPEEREGGRTIGNGVCIPLGELTSRLSELPPKTTELYVHCERGGRSANACMVLENMGYVCHNLEGGYAAYHSIKK